MRARSTRAPLLFLLLFLAACGTTLTFVSFQITRDASEDPFPGATAVTVSVRQDGVLLPRSVERTSLLQASFTTPTVPFGTGYTLRVDVMDGQLLLARGTSTSFEARSSGDEALPDVFVAPLGRFAQWTTRSAPVPVAAALAGEQVVLGNVDGSITALDLHDASTQPRVDAAAGRRFVALPGGLLAIADSDALFVDAEVHSASDPSLGRHGADALLVPVSPGVPDEPCAYVLGGRADPVAFTRLCLAGGVLVITPMVDLGLGGWGGSAALVTLEGDQQRIAWVSRQNAGGASDALTLVNLESPAAVASATFNPPLPTSGAVAVAHGVGELLVIGGRTLAGVQAEIRRLVVQPSTAVAATPTPEALFTPREGSAWSPVAAGVYLVHGGTNAGGTRALRAELVDVRNFPGTVAPTGELPTADPLVVVALDDHAQLAIGANGVWRYASPRGFE